MKKCQGTGDRVGRLVFLLVGVAVVAGAADPQLAQAHKLYQLTEFDQSLKVLHNIAIKDAAVYELIGQNYYGQANYKKATEALEKALALDPGSSEINLWLGRAFG
ncbi:MAG TPA: tetratricopeptide repeat protein, partial [Candidatus Solibacter sp.]|nr:tetratricopeptide repeat protein [Candidatus Solibacter sp.]